MFVCPSKHAQKVDWEKLFEWPLCTEFKGQCLHFCIQIRSLKIHPWTLPLFPFPGNFYRFSIPDSGKRMHIKGARHDGMVLIRSFSYLPYFSGYCSIHLFNIAFFRLNLNYEPITVVNNFLLIGSSSIDRRKQCLPGWFWRRVWLRFVWLLNLNLLAPTILRQDGMGGTRFSTIWRHDFY